MDAALAHDLDLAKMKPEAPLQLGVKFLVGQRNQAPRFLRFLGPHDGRAPSGERKNRKRSGGQEMLLGATAVIARVRHCGDDCALTVWPAVRAPSAATSSVADSGSPSSISTSTCREGEGLENSATASG